MLEKNCHTEETDASTTSKKDSRFLSSFDNKDTQIEIVMAEKRDNSLITSGQQLEMTGMSKSIIEPQNVAPINLDTPEDQLEKSISPRQEDCNPHPATGVYSSPYCSTATLLSGIPDCLHSGNIVLLALSVQGEVFIYQITGDIYAYDEANELFTSVGNIDQGTTEDLQKF